VEDNRWEEDYKPIRWTIMSDGTIRTIHIEDNANILDLSDNLMLKLWAWRTLHAGEKL